jgi:ribulose 1,5-bisphosphate synthetase/thiazole synthase
LDLINADYLVIGAGATGMAFTDALIADSDATVVLADGRHSPGGHFFLGFPAIGLRSFAHDGVG